MNKERHSPVPDNVTESYLDYLYDEVGLAEGIAYETLRKEWENGSMGFKMISAYMKSVFDVCYVPERDYE